MVFFVDERVDFGGAPSTCAVPTDVKKNLISVFCFLFHFFSVTFITQFCMKNKNELEGSSKMVFFLTELGNEMTGFCLK